MIQDRVGEHPLFARSAAGDVPIPARKKTVSRAKYILSDRDILPGRFRRPNAAAAIPHQKKSLSRPAPF